MFPAFPTAKFCRQIHGLTLKRASTIIALGLLRARGSERSIDMVVSNGLTILALRIPFCGLNADFSRRTASCNTSASVQSVSGILDSDDWSATRRSTNSLLWIGSKTEKVSTKTWKSEILGYREARISWSSLTSCTDSLIILNDCFCSNIESCTHAG